MSVPKFYVQVSNNCCVFLLVCLVYFCFKYAFIHMIFYFCLESLNSYSVTSFKLFRFVLLND